MGAVIVWITVPHKDPHVKCLITGYPNWAVVAPLGGPVGRHWGESMPLKRMTGPFVASSLLVHGADVSSFVLLQLLSWPLSHTGPNREASQAQTGTFKLWGKINLYSLQTDCVKWNQLPHPWIPRDTIVCSHKKFKETLLIMAPRQKQAKYVPNR